MSSEKEKKIEAAAKAMYETQYDPGYGPFETSPVYMYFAQLARVA